jgi:putative FmdB family regulatory protein
MPTYTYYCKHCYERTEAVQKITESPLTKCPVCKEETLTRLVTSGNFVLKGENWFKTSGHY